MRFSLLATYLSITLVITLLYACRGDAPKQEEADAISPLTDSAVEATYSLFTEGRYRDYALKMQSTEGKPEEYIKEMETLYKQHAAELRDNYGGIKTFKINRIRTKEGDPSAVAFLEVTYGNGSEEEIMLTFIHDAGQWKLR